ncbi:MAG: T9SS type A sorting domain-containing protein [Chlorobi bacterium]|nr:T9SS type A sorting domain-containing protein [Chlorobiota bacterium]
MKKLKFITLSFCLIAVFYTTQSQTWSNIGPGAGSDLHYLVIQPDNKDVIYTAGDIEGIFKSTDGGNSWQNINHNLTNMPYGSDIYWINEIKLDPANYQRIYICDGVGFFKSEDGGDTWQKLFPTVIDDNNPPVETSAIAVDSADPSRLFLGLGDEAGECSFSDFLPFPGYDGPWGIYRSMDSGQTWTAINNGLPDSLSVHTIDIIPNTDTIVMATNRGVFRSDDGGATWLPKNSGLPHDNCYRISVDNDYGSYILTLTLKVIGNLPDSTTFSGGIFRSDDLGDTWYDITGNLPKYDPYDELFYDYWKFDIDPTDVDVIYIATNPGSGYDQTGIFATWDGGINWDLIYTPIIGGWMDTAFFWEGYAYDIRIAKSDPSRMAICRDHVEVSDDSGNTWHNAFTNAVGGGWKGNGLECMNTESVAFDPADSNKMYVGYDDFGLFRSDDGGNSFLRLDSHEDPVIGTISDIDAVKDILVDPVNGDLYIERYQGSQGGLMAGYTSGGLVFSSDNGVTVSDITGNLPKDGRYDVTIDFTSGTTGNRTIYAAIYHNGVYKSTDGGASWNTINTGLGANTTYVWDIAINPLNVQELYLGINSWGAGFNGLYKSVDGGQNWSQVSGIPSGDIGKVYISNQQDVFIGISDNFDWSSSGGLYRSSDHGTTWNKILSHSRVVDVDINPANSNVIMAVGQQWYNMTLTEDHGIFISEDNGVSWNVITSQNITHTGFNFARFNPHNPLQVYAGTAGGGLWRTTLNITTGTPPDNSEHLSEIKIWPNPARDKLTISRTGMETPAEISILNILGEEVLNIVNSGQKKWIVDVSRWKPGIYLIRLKTNQDISLLRFVKK